MKRLKFILAALAALADTLAVMDLKGIADLMPNEWAAWVAGIPSAAAVIVHLMQALNAQLAKWEQDFNKDLP